MIFPLSVVCFFSMFVSYIPTLTQQNNKNNSSVNLDKDEISLLQNRDKYQINLLKNLSISNWNPTTIYNSEDLLKDSGKNRYGGPTDTGPSSPPGHPGHTADRLLPTNGMEEVTGEVSDHGATLWVNNKQVYRRYNHTQMWGVKKMFLHAGLHLIVLNQKSFKVMYSSHFQTWQPAPDRYFVKILNTIQDGRLLVLLGSPIFSNWLREEAVKSIMDLGDDIDPVVARGEPWALVLRKQSRGGVAQPHKEVDKNGPVTSKGNLNLTLEQPTQKSKKVLYEGTTISRNYTEQTSSPFTFSISIEPRPEFECWKNREDLNDRYKFCKHYEGYGDFCSCVNPLMTQNDVAQPSDIVKQIIPICLITANRFNLILRQVTHLRQNPGGKETPLLLCVDGNPNLEGEQFAPLINISAIFHNNPTTIGTMYRVNEHIRWCLQEVFKYYHNIDKVIILEDDLLLAPDFIGYFQQVAVLMDMDDSISVVNAYNYNSFPHTADDPTKIYRVHTYPYYGWMVSKKTANILLDNWVPRNTDGDWDLFLHQYVMNNNDVIIPEVSRTKHEGAGGVHVTGYVQEGHYSLQPITDKVNITLNLRRTWVTAYTIDLMSAITKGVIVNVTKHPCLESPIPKYQNKTHVIYLNSEGEDNNSTAKYRVLAKCLGFYGDNQFQNYLMTVQMKYFKTPFIIVACPVSPYCVDVDKSVIYNPTPEDLVLASSRPMKISRLTNYIHWRRSIYYLEEEYDRINYVVAIAYLKD